LRRGQLRAPESHASASGQRVDVHVGCRGSVGAVVLGVPTSAGEAQPDRWWVPVTAPDENSYRVLQPSESASIHSGRGFGVAGADLGGHRQISDHRAQWLETVARMRVGRRRPVRCQLPRGRWRAMPGHATDAWFDDGHVRSLVRLGTTAWACFEAKCVTVAGRQPRR